MTSGDAPLPMTDPAWLQERIDDTARRWGSLDPRVNATLWWYAASSTIAIPSLGAAVTGAPIPRPDLSRGSLRPYGYLATIGAAGTVPLSELGDTLYQQITPVLSTLAELGRVTPRSLWAIQVDSISNRALDRSRSGEAAPETAAQVAATVVDDLATAGAPVPRARFQDVTVAGELHTVRPSDLVAAGRRRATRRASCCLIHKTTDTPDQPPGMCASCPRLGHQRGERMAAALFR